jgi:hypothetical protein
VQAGTDVFGLHVKGPTGVQQVGLAVVMLATLLLFPRGLSGSREFTFLERPLTALAARRRRRSPGQQEALVDLDCAPPIPQLDGR